MPDNTRTGQTSESPLDTHLEPAPEQARDDKTPEGEAAHRHHVYSARRARQGQVILDSPLRKAVFFGGLAGIVILLLFLALFGLMS